MRIKQIDISYNIFFSHYNCISFHLTLDFCEISEKIFPGQAPVFFSNNGDSFCFNNPLLYRKPVCLRIAIAFSRGSEHKEDGKEENLAVLKRESCSSSAATAAAELLKQQEQQQH